MERQQELRSAHGHPPPTMTMPRSSEVERVAPGRQCREQHEPAEQHDVVQKVADVGPAAGRISPRRFSSIDHAMSAAVITRHAVIIRRQAQRWRAGSPPTREMRSAISAEIVPSGR